jgi:hypothetical protein
MTLTIELAEEQVAALKAKAAAEGLSLEGWLGKIADQEAEPPLKPLKSAYGVLAKYGPGPSAEEIDENRRDMLKGFGEKF